MEIAPMTKRDKILLYVVLMLAFVVLFVRFLLIPGLENHQQADADLREAQDAQTSMQDAIMLAGTYADGLSVFYMHILCSVITGFIHSIEKCLMR